ncbi:hypothetical protein AMTRI_Chr11g152700 [Amborella trichopoda]
MEPLPVNGCRGPGRFCKPTWPHKTSIVQLTSMVKIAAYPCNLHHPTEFDGVCFMRAWPSIHEGRIYQLKLFCDKDYPEKPPSVRFHSRINMTCVNHETGVTMEDKLTQLKMEMTAPYNNKLVQPPESTFF